MGGPNVFEIHPYIGMLVGIMVKRFNGIIDITIYLPFIAFGIYCKKSKHNNWFGMN